MLHHPKLHLRQELQKLHEGEPLFCRLPPQRLRYPSFQEQKGDALGRLVDYKLAQMMGFEEEIIEENQMEQEGGYTIQFGQENLN